MASASGAGARPSSAETCELRVSTICLHEQRLLMVQEARGRDRYRWNLPGGRIDPGESLGEAAVRETLEETGCQVRLRALAGLYPYTTRSSRPRLRVVFLADLVAGRAAADGVETVDVAWVDPARAVAMADQQLRHPRLLRRVLNDIAAGVRGVSLDILRDADAVSPETSRPLTGHLADRGLLLPLTAA